MTCPPDREPSPHDSWDAFIDALDRAGQREGGAHNVRIPSTIGVTALAGRAFGELTADEAKHLSRVAAALGRRSDTILTLWKDTKDRLRAPSQRPRPDKRRRSSR